MAVYQPIDNAERQARQMYDEYLIWRIHCLDEDVAAMTEWINDELKRIHI